MKSLTLCKILSPKTHSVGAGKVNVSMTTTLMVDALLIDSARRLGISRNQLLRERQVIAAEAVADSNAPALRRELGLPSILTVANRVNAKEQAEVWEHDLETQKTVVAARHPMDLMIDVCIAEILNK